VVVARIRRSSENYGKIMDSNSMTSNLLNSKFRPLIEVQAGMQGSADMQTPKPIQYKNVNNSVTAQDLATRLLFEIGT
jgi:hypothetical protein